MPGGSRQQQQQHQWQQQQQQQQQRQQQQQWQGGVHDPFSSMGFPPMMRSLFDDPFFTQDPFNDPFFRNPFGGGLFGGSPFGRGPLGGGLFGGGAFGGGPFGGSHFGAFMSPFPQLQAPVFDRDMSHQQQNGHVANRQLPPAPSVQEVDDPVTPRGGRGGSGGEPIVEHPESDEEKEEAQEEEEDEAEDEQEAPVHGQGRAGYTQAGQQQQHQTLVTNSHPFPGLSSFFGGSGGGSSSSSVVFQSSYVSHSGIGGTQYYESSSTRQVGANGVVEEQHTQRDSSGRESMAISRGIHEKGRTVARTRRGREETSTEILHNITPEEAQSFDATWQQHARGEFGSNQRRELPQLPAPSGDHQHRPQTRRRTFRN